MPWLLLQQKPFYSIRLERRRGFRERKLRALVTANCWPDSRPRRPVTSPGAGPSWHLANPARAAPPPHASSPGGRRLWAQAAGPLTKLHIWGVFHPGKQARHSEGEATTLACKGLIQLLQKRSSQERETAGWQPLSAPRAEPAFSSSGSQGDRQGPRWMVRSPQPSSRGSKSRGWRWTDGVTYYCDKEKSLRASL